MASGITSLAQVSVPNGSAAAMGATSATGTKGVQVQAAYANTVSVFVGDSSVDATHGFELAPGDSVFVPVPDPSKIFVFASSTSQKANGLVF